MNRVVTRLGFTTFALVAGVAAHAQSPTTGMVVGTVKDANGAPIAGAQVILSGPAIQGPRTMTTNADGSFRFPLIPSGAGYQIQASKAGFQASVNKGVSVEAWKSSTSDFKLKSGEVAAVVEVVATQQSIDTQSVVQATTLTQDSIRQLPLASREVAGAVFLSPGVVDGGRGAGNPNIGGGTAFENNYIVDGQNVTDPQYGENRTRINNLAVESVQVQTGGFEPEYGRATGGVISVVTRTGSNEFKFDLEATLMPKSGIAKVQNNADLAFNAARVAQGDTKTLALWVGGPIIKDVLWYSLGVSTGVATTERSYSQVYFLDPDQAPRNPLTQPLAGADNVGTNYSLDSKFLGITGKLTYALNTDNTIEMGIGRNRQTDDVNNLGMTFTPLAEVVKVKPQDVDTLSINWRSSLTANWLLDVRAGTYKRKNSQDLTAAQGGQMFVATGAVPYLLAGDYLQDGSGPVFPAFAARAFPGLQFGGWGFINDSELTRKQFTAKGTNFIGAHTLKYGVDYDETGFKSFSGYTGGALVTRDYNVDPVSGAFISFRDTYRFRLGAGGATVYNTTGTTPIVDNVLLPGQGLDLDSKTKNLAYFVQDTWQINKNWTVIGGIRIDSQKLYGGDGQEYFKFGASQMTAPRFGVNFDPNGDGKTKLSFAFGRFYETVPMDLNQRAGSIEGFVQFRRTYSGANAIPYVFVSPGAGDVFQYNAGTGTYNLNTPNAANGGGTATFRRTIGGEKSLVDPDIKPQSIEEVSLGWEQQLTELWKFGAKWKYRYYKNVVEDFSFDFGTTYLIGNPGQGGLGSVPVHVQEYDAPGQDIYVNFPKPVRDYRELILTLDKAKGNDRWAGNVSLTFASNIGNFAGLDSPLNGQADPNITSTYDLPVLMRNTYGTLPNSPRYNFQASGTYDLGMGFVAGGRFIYRAGTAISAVGPDLGGVIGGIWDQTYAGLGGPGGLYGMNAGEYLVFNGQFLHTGNYGDNEALLEPRGSRGVTPDVTRFDLHLEWSTDFQLITKAKFTAFLDVFNVFNQQMVLTVDQRKQTSTTVAGAIAGADGIATGPINPGFQGVIAVDNPRFLKPTSFQAPRNFAFGVRFSF